MLDSLFLRIGLVLFCGGLCLQSVAALSEHPSCGNGVADSEEQCDDSNNMGGDGCAANCTNETRRRIQHQPGLCAGGPLDGEACVRTAQCNEEFSSERTFRCEGNAISGITVQTENYRHDLPLRGFEDVIIGAPRDFDVFSPDGTVVAYAGEVPFVVSVETTEFEPIRDRDRCLSIRFDPAIRPTGKIACGAKSLPVTDYEWIAQSDAAAVDPDCVEGHVNPDDASQRCVQIPQFPTFTGPGRRGSVIIQATLQVFDDPNGCPPTNAGIEGGNVIVRVPFVATTGLVTASFLNAGTSGAIGGGSKQVCGLDQNCSALDEICVDSELLSACDSSAAEGVCHCDSNCDGQGCVSVSQGHTLNCDAFLTDPYLGFPEMVLVAAVPQDRFAGFLSFQVTSVVLAEAGAPAPAWTPTPTPTATSTEAPPATDTPTVTPTPTARFCSGDCNSNLRVSLAEVVAGIHILLGNLPFQSCRRLDLDANETATVDEVVQAVNSSRDGCPVSQSNSLGSP